MSAHANFLQRRPLADARTILVAEARAVDAEEIAVDDALGRVAAETVVARHPSPHYRASAMDGIALRSADTWKAADAPLLLRALSSADAEPGSDDPCCVAVDTGSLLPDWTDAVLRIEETTATDGGYRIKSVVAPGSDVRRAGEDIPEGAVLIPAGARVRAWDIGAMLATGTTRVRVRRRPNIAILATGSEVVEPGADARAGQVIDSNSRVIASLVEEWGGSAHRLGIVADDEQGLARGIDDAARRFDAVCVIAGSSAGRKDFTIATLASLGEVLVHGVDIAPGRPVALARLGGRAGTTTPVIAVPGYPVSAIVVCEQLLRPLVAAFLGAAEVLPHRTRARLARKIPSRLGMEEFRRVALVHHDGRLPIVAPLPSGAASISTVSGAHGWLRIAAPVEGLDAGTEVDIELLVSLDDVESALVMAGPRSPLTVELELRLRGVDLRARVIALGLGPNDVLAAVARGEAHAAFVDALPAGSSLELRALAAFDARVAVVAGSAADQALAAIGAQSPAS